MIDVEKNIREYIDKTVHMSLATVKDNKPWVCEVHFAYDEGLNIYFVSKVITRHCQEIAASPFVAGNIVKQHELTEAPHGVYYEGVAELLRDPSREDIGRYCQSLNRNVDELTGQLKEENGRRMYKITVKNWAIFGNFDGNGHKKHELEWNGGNK